MYTSTIFWFSSKKRLLQKQKNNAQMLGKQCIGKTKDCEPYIGLCRYNRKQNVLDCPLQCAHLDDSPPQTSTVQLLFTTSIPNLIFFEA